MRRLLLLFLLLVVVVLLLAAAVARLQQGTNAVVASSETVADTNAAPPQATAIPPESVAPAIVATARTHTVQRGETLFSIARRYGVDLSELAAANGIRNPNLLYAGDVLTIPGAAPEPQATAVAPLATATTVPLTPATATPIMVEPSLDYSTLAVNGIPLREFVIMDAGALQNTRAIFARGQTLGRNPRAYAKVGDSTIEDPYFMARFDGEPYNLGEYGYLQGVIDHFAGSHARDSVAVRVGFHSWTAFDPLWSDKARCQPNEGPLPCELRLHNPSIVIVRLGANDVGATRLFEDSIRQIVSYALENGVIPVLGTKPDRHEGSDINNEILRRVAAEYQIPLWEYDRVAATMPGRGLGQDQVHMTGFYAHDYTQPEAFQRGHSVHNLAALMLLDALMKDVILAVED